ncbi:MAG TPA: 1,4-alpha-glucan branching protein domain-containing protein [Anaerolineales bacterium]|nr:1,4-alpha-glucan branching protein domain-containing protein [Anaerolineales bacterium]
MAADGAFTFVLHSHLPYTRRAGRWPHGEEWLHEASAETYVPLLDMLHKLQAEGVGARLTLGLTPVLLEQLADADVRRNFETYVEDKIRAAEADISRWKSEGDLHLSWLAGFYAERYRSVLRSFQDAYHRDLVGAFARLEDAGLIEVVTCAATHGYLPLLDRDESINLQLQTAVAAHRRHLGRAPRAIWLPECAYRPAFEAEDGRVRPGIETFLARHGLGLFFTETHMIEGGLPVGVAAGEAIGPYGAVTRRYLVPLAASTAAMGGTTFLPYYVNEPRVAVLGRENKTGLQVWSADWGYPGDFDYREFHKKDGISGMQYWRISGARVGLGEKDAYHPDWAEGKVRQHADHFAHLVAELLAGFHAETGKYGMICANYDTELFGHWWFEGIDWLEGVIRRLADTPSVDLTSASAFLDAHPPETVIRLPEGSWGAGGNHFVWDNADTHWMWPLIHQAESRFASAVQRAGDVGTDAKSVLDQAARELLLLQSSDWPFLVTTGQAREYAVERFHGHLENFGELLAGSEAGRPDAALAARLWEKDKVFPDIDHRWFRA